MSILAWVILGLIAGFLGSKIVNKTGEGVLMDIVLGVIGSSEKRPATAGRPPQSVRTRQTVLPLPVSA